MKEPRDEDFSSLQTLLRLKRHETPPADSVEDFLSEFHRRQRAELLRRPLWRIALDRLESLFEIPTLATPRLAYAGACAVALTIAATGLVSRGFVGTQSPTVATKEPPTNPPIVVTDNASRGHFTLTASPSSSQHAPIGFMAAPPNTADRAMVRFANTDTEGDDTDFRSPALAARVPTRSNPAAAMTTAMAPRTNSLQPRYVLESHPVRYEPRSPTF